ncbi:MAG: phosphoglycerate kinase [Chlamydiales bacterium]
MIQLNHKEPEKLSIQDLCLQGKKIIMRVDFNVPIDADGSITDTTRIQAALPSIFYLLKQSKALILMSHLGRPDHPFNHKFSLLPVAKALETFIRRPVKMAPDCIGQEVKEMAINLKQGDVLLLENLRFHPAELQPSIDPDFAKELASLADVYVNDAFATAHRKHSSTYTITQFFSKTAAAGFLLEKEVSVLSEILNTPKRPFYALIGGAKISTKIGLIKNLLKKTDLLFLSGGMAYTFFKVLGYEVGQSMFDPKFFKLAKDILEDFHDKIILPKDARIAKNSHPDTPIKVVDLAKEGIPKGYSGLDIGPKTIHHFATLFQHANTILWNGPVGVCELPAYSQGTYELAYHLTQLDAVTIVGGGDLVAAINQAGLKDKMTYISTGGGATLDYLEHGTLPCIQALSNKSPKISISPNKENRKDKEHL